MLKSALRISLVLSLLAAVALTTGCTYFGNRGRDAREIMDIGFSYTPRATPEFGLYWDFFNVTPIGYARMNHSRTVGMGFGKTGNQDFQADNWGILLWGSERQGIGEFDAQSAYQARPDQRDLAERPRYNVGIVRMLAQGNPPPTQQFFECQRDPFLHLGWVGFHFAIRFHEFADFLVGWTTLDFRGDDRS